MYRTVILQIIPDFIKRKIHISIDSKCQIMTEKFFPDKMWKDPIPHLYFPAQ